ncbi:hypothetical protein [Kangiella sp. HZ709]|uniref:hypothetical protein n=1 Tax=Kangiella sp. HZ709 TaxID=2666328 RepID=UPI0012AF3336|nr:hypothetical protein [Kangiella sp. HZ709]MRX26680.1 hypothetical protein [Kangiella sp. HZ709]
MNLDNHSEKKFFAVINHEIEQLQAPNINESCDDKILELINSGSNNNNIRAKYFANWNKKALASAVCVIAFSLLFFIPNQIKQGKINTAIADSKALENKISQIKSNDLDPLIYLAAQRVNNEINNIDRVIFEIYNSNQFYESQEEETIELWNQRIKKLSELQYIYENGLAANKI